MEMIKKSKVKQLIVIEEMTICTTEEFHIKSHSFQNIYYQSLNKFGDVKKEGRLYYFYCYYYYILY